MSSTRRTRNAPNPWALLLLALVAIGLVAAFATGAVNSLFPPAPATEQAQEIRDLYDKVFYVAAAIFFVVEGLIIWTVVRYRRRPGDDELPPQTHGNNLAEFAWTIVPTIIVAVLFVLSWQTLNSVEQVSDEPDVTVRVTGAQFTWTFTYLDGETEVFKQTATTGERGGLFLPVGRTVQLRMSSPDVIHSFYVPELLFKRDVNPDPTGRENVFEFTIKESFAGQTLHGQCAELCGIGHRSMVFDVHALSAADYDAWLAEASKPKPSGDAGPVGTTLEMVAKDIAFEPKALTVPADEPFAIDLDNQDPAGVQHDVDIRQADGTTVVADVETVDGGERTTYRYEPLAPGEYTFICSIHPVPAMTGTLTVE